MLLTRTDLNDGQTERYSADFKAKIALEALRGELTTAQLATKHGIHQTMVGEWKKQAMEGLTAVFSDRSAAAETARASEADVEKLHAKNGQLLGTGFFGELPLDLYRSINVFIERLWRSLKYECIYLHACTRSRPLWNCVPG